jgi:hypothetical protein
MAALEVYLRGRLSGQVLIQHVGGHGFDPQH